MIPLYVKKYKSPGYTKFEGYTKSDTSDYQLL